MKERMNQQNTAANSVENDIADHAIEDDQEHVIQIAGANLPSGEPVVVMLTGATASILPLQLAQDIADALIKAIARSVVTDSMIPAVPARLQEKAEPTRFAPTAALRANSILQFIQPSSKRRPRMAKSFKMDSKVSVPSCKSDVGNAFCKLPSQKITGKLKDGMSGMSGSKGLGQAVKTVKSNPIQGANVQKNSSMGKGGVIDPFI